MNSTQGACYPAVLSGGGNGGYIQKLDSQSESQSKVRDLLGMTEGVIGALHETISQAEQRLDTVLTPAPPPNVTATSNQTSPVPRDSHLAHRIAELNGGCQHALDRLRELLRRIEL